MKFYEIETKYNTELKEFAHIITFEFEHVIFNALVIENEDVTFVASCYNVDSKIEIEIPQYFGTGFSDKVFNFLYNQIKTSKLIN